MLKSSNGGLVVVTGATGHVGNVLVRELVARGHRVRVVVPEAEDVTPISDLGLDTVTGDVRDHDSLARAFEGADVVFHLAGIVTISSGLSRLLDEVNVRGTRNVVRACLDVRIRRLVYTSSVHALCEPPHGVPVREESVFKPETLLGDYAQSKARASAEVMKGLRDGLDAVIAFPSGVIGPYDYKPSEMGQLFLEFGRGRLRPYVDGAYDFVDVRDVVGGLVSAMEKGRRGEGYILSGNRVTVRQMLDVLGQVTGRSPFRFRVPRALALAAAALAPAYSRLTAKRLLFTDYSIRVLGSNCLMDRNKAETELGYRVRPFAETVESAIRWFRDTGRLESGNGRPQ